MIPYPDFFTKAEKRLGEVIDRLWQRDSEWRMRAEAEIEDQKQRHEEENEKIRFIKIMKQRQKKLSKTLSEITKPYEIPLLGNKPESGIPRLRTKQQTK
nr:transmembrane protein 232-like [Meriones unguiculatus]